MKKLRPIVPHPTDPTLALVELTKDYWAVISAMDGPSVGRFNWYALVTRNGSVYGVRKPSRGGILLHRFVSEEMGLTLTAEVDHENRNGLDCRRSNLRDATRGQNTENTRLRSDSATGVKGLHWYKQTQRWQAKIAHGGRQLHLGYFVDKDEAIKALAEARKEIHGEFATEGN